MTEKVQEIVQPGGPARSSRDRFLSWLRTPGELVGFAAVLLVALVIANIVAIPGFLSSSGYLALLVAGLAPLPSLLSPALPQSSVAAVGSTYPSGRLSAS